jgi:hypothetical protein
LVECLQRARRRCFEYVRERAPELS